MKIFVAIICLLTVQDYYHAYAQQTDLRGPIQSDQFKVNRTPEGIFATDFTYKPLENSALNAHWIWLNPKNFPDQQSTKAHYIGKRKDAAFSVIKFKKIVVINEEVTFANIKLSADIQYRLFINGKLIERGPANIGSDYNDFISPQHWFYDGFTNKKAFKKGVNVVAVEVSTFVKQASSTTMGHGGLILDANIKLKSGKNIMLNTDTSWLCEPSKAIQPNLDVDGSKESSAWITSDDYDTTWGHAFLLPDSIASKWKLRQSELPQMMEAKILPFKTIIIKSLGDTMAATFPLTLKASTTPQIVRLEFDELYTGYLGLSVNGKAGTKLNIQMRENTNKAQEVNYILGNGAQTYEFSNLIDGKHIDITILNPESGVTINEVDINFSAFPTNYIGSFTCSDPQLNAIWKNIRWVTQMNMQTYHMDSPLHQEPVSDAGDYLIESMVNYYAFFSPLLIKQDLRKIALVLSKTDYQMFHTSYMLLWVQMLTNYYQFTGDKELLRELSPQVYGLMNKFHGYMGSQGIITQAPNYMFMDWGTYDHIGFHHPPASWGEGYLTAFYYKALTDAAKIAAYLNDNQRSATYIAESSKLKAGFNNALFDGQKKLYKNGLDNATAVKAGKWLPKDTTLSVILPYANTLAVAYCLSSPEDNSEILNYVLTQNKITVSPYFMYFTFDAIDRADEFNQYGLEQLRRWKKLSGYPVGLKEGWAMGDYSHAWGGSPGYELPARVLGITPSKPGFAEVMIKPNPGDLETASGTVATPLGTVKVNWEQNDKHFFITSTSPVNMPQLLFLPIDKNCIVVINGKKLMNNSRFVTTDQFTSELSGTNKILIKTKGGSNEIKIYRE